MPRIASRPAPAPIALLFVAAAGVGSAQQPARASSELVRFTTELDGVVAQVRPSVVQVLVAGYAPPTEPSDASLLSRQFGSGSGVIVDPSGYVVTNAHVVQGARRIQVLLPAGPSDARSILKTRGRTVGAQLVGLDRETDVAVLKIAESGLPALPFGDSEALRQGQLVLAIGSPLGLEGSVSLGVVSSVARQLTPDDPMIYIQTDAAINRGNSGGPLVDIGGRIVGINTLIFSQSGGSEGIGFAAPSHIVRSVYEQISRGGRVRRGEIGARVQTITPALARGLGLPRESGVVVSDVRPGGPAAETGLKIADVVASLDGKPLENARQMEVNLYRRAPGVSVSLELLRGSSRLSLAVPVVERPGDRTRLLDRVSPDQNVIPRLNVLALDLSEDMEAMIGPVRARAGVVVAVSQAEALPFADTLEAGDVIYALNHEPVASVAKLRSVVQSLKPGEPAVLQVERDEQLRFVVLTLE